MWLGSGLLTRFLMMDGYGAYVWSAFAFAILVLGSLLWQSYRFSRKQRVALDRLLAEAPRGQVRRRRARVVRHDDEAVKRPDAELPGLGT